MRRNFEFMKKEGDVSSGLFSVHDRGQCDLMPDDALRGTIEKSIGELWW